MIKVFRFILTLIFLTQSVPVDMDAAGRHESGVASMLSPSSRFWYLPDIEESNDGYLTIVHSPQFTSFEKTNLLSFKDEAVFMYLSRLIVQALTKYEGRVSPQLLISLIEKHFSFLEPFGDTGFAWRKLYRDGDAFCLPYVSTLGDSPYAFIVKYYPSGENEKNFYDGFLIRSDHGQVSVEIGSTADITEGDALMSYIDIVKDIVSFSEITREGETCPQMHMQELFGTFLSMLNKDFKNAEDFSEISRQILKEDGLDILRAQMSGEILNKELREAFLRISGPVSKERSISVYGIVLFFLTGTEAYFSELERTERHFFQSLKREGFIDDSELAEEHFSEGSRIRRHMGEELFSAYGKEFSLAEIKKWRLPEGMAEEVFGYFPELRGKREELIYSMGERRLVNGNISVELSSLAEKGVSAKKIFENLQQRSELFEYLTENFRSERERIRSQNSWIIDHIFRKCMQNHTSKGLKFSKEGASYHIAVHDTVHLYPKGLIFEGREPLYAANIKPYYNEIAPEDRTASRNALKVKRALEMWKKYSPDTAYVRRRFEESASVVELDMDTMLLFSDPSENVIRPIQMGRKRHVFYISKEYLDVLREDRVSDMKELAFLLKLGQTFLEQGVTEKDDEVRQAEAEDFNLHFLKRCTSTGLIDISGFRKRMFRFMQKDLITRFTNSMEEILKNEQDIILTERELERPGTSFEQRISLLRRLFWLNYSLLLRCGGLGMEEMADRQYTRLRETVRKIQHYDSAGRTPYDFQVNIVFAALKFGNWEDFWKEAESLLMLKNIDTSGRVFGGDKDRDNFPGAVVTEKVIAEIEADLIKALRAQLSVMDPARARSKKKKLEELAEKACQTRKLLRQEWQDREEREKKEKIGAVIANSAIVELAEDVPWEEAFRIASKEGALLTGADENDIFEKLLAREKESSTVMGEGIAIPHMVLEEDKGYSMVVIKAREKLEFPSGVEVKDMFFLLGPRSSEQQKKFHTTLMASLAVICMREGFMDAWREGSGEEVLRDILMSFGESAGVLAGEEKSEPGTLDRSDAEISSASPKADREKEHARELVESMIIASEALFLKASHREEKLVIGIDTEWMPDQSGLQGLLNTLIGIPQLLFPRGSENIIIVRRKGAHALAGALKDIKKETGTDISNFLIMSGADRIADNTFADFSGSGRIKGAFFAGIDVPEGFSDDPFVYVRIVEILKIVVRMAMGIPFRQDGLSGVSIHRSGERSYTYSPARSLILDGVNIYELQRREIDTKA